jgi:hypothetical protein
MERNFYANGNKLTNYFGILTNGEFTLWLLSNLYECSNKSSVLSRNWLWNNKPFFSNWSRQIAAIHKHD